MKNQLHSMKLSCPFSLIWYMFSLYGTCILVPNGDKSGDAEAFIQCEHIEFTVARFINRYYYQK